MMDVMTGPLDCGRWALGEGQPPAGRSKEVRGATFLAAGVTEEVTAANENLVRHK